MKPGPWRFGERVDESLRLCKTASSAELSKVVEFSARVIAHPCGSGPKRFLARGSTPRWGVPPSIEPAPRRAAWHHPQMGPKRYLTGIELQPLTIFADDRAVEGFELRMRYLDVDAPEKPRSVEPFFIDEESLLSMLDGLREQVQEVQRERDRKH
jgi:hypothetical protein